MNKSFLKATEIFLSHNQKILITHGCIIIIMIILFFKACGQARKTKRKAFEKNKNAKKTSTFVEILCECTVKIG